MAAQVGKVQKAKNTGKWKHCLIFESQPGTLHQLPHVLQHTSNNSHVIV